jgi:hypothetical protein
MYFVHCYIRYTLLTLQDLLKRFVKKDSIPLSASNLVRLDVSDKDILLHHGKIDVGLGAENCLKVELRRGNKFYSMSFFCCRNW